jgi:hypothetical protein
MVFIIFPAISTKFFESICYFYMMLATISKLEILSLTFVKDNALLTSTYKSNFNILLHIWWGFNFNIKKSRNSLEVWFRFYKPEIKNSKPNPNQKKPSLTGFSPK